VSRLLPVVRTYAGFVAGMLAIPLRAYTLATFAGSFLWCLIFVSIGAALGAHWSLVRRPAEIAGIVVLIALVIALLWVTLVQLRHRGAP